MFFLLTILALGCLALVSVRAAEPVIQDLVIEPLSDKTRLLNDFETHTWIGSNGVVVRQGDAVLTADNITLDETARHVVADGNVTLQGEKLFWVGDFLEYNFNTREIGANSYRAGIGPLFVAGDKLTGASTNKLFHADSALITTDDQEHPSYHVLAKSVTIHDREVTARDATLYLGNTPVFYL